MTLLFGGDKVAADDIAKHVSDDTAALDNMDKILNDPTTSPAVKQFTQQREATVRAELVRLQGIAEQAKLKKGIFG